MCASKFLCIQFILGNKYILTYLYLFLNRSPRKTLSTMVMPKAIVSTVTNTATVMFFLLIIVVELS